MGPGCTEFTMHIRNAFRTPSASTVVTSNHVVRSPLGTVFHGPWPTSESAWAFARSVAADVAGGGETDRIAKSIEQVEPYSFTT
jgi:hypothetical protein